MAQRLLVEDAEALVDRAALLLDLDVDRRELVVQLLPVRGVAAAADHLVAGKEAAVRDAAPHDL